MRLDNGNVGSDSTQGMDFCLVQSCVPCDWPSNHSRSPTKCLLDYDDDDLFVIPPLSIAFYKTSTPNVTNTDPLRQENANRLNAVHAKQTSHHDW